MVLFHWLQRPLNMLEICVGTEKGAGVRIHALSVWLDLVHTLEFLKCVFNLKKNMHWFLLDLEWWSLTTISTDCFFFPIMSMGIYFWTIIHVCRLKLGKAFLRVFLFIYSLAFRRHQHKRNSQKEKEGSRGHKAQRVQHRYNRAIINCKESWHAPIKAIPEERKSCLKWKPLGGWRNSSVVKRG